MHFPSLETPCTTFIVNSTFCSLCPLFSRLFLTSCRRKKNGVNGAGTWGLSIATCGNEVRMCKVRSREHDSRKKEVKLEAKCRLFRRVTESNLLPIKRRWWREDPTKAAHLTEVFLKQDAVFVGMHDGRWNGTFQIITKPQLVYNGLQWNKLHANWRHGIRTWTMCWWLFFLFSYFIGKVLYREVLQQNCMLCLQVFWTR